MKYGVVVTGLALMALSACASPQERAQKQAERENKACMERGLEPGTEAFDACRVQVREKQRQRMEDRMRNSDDFRPKGGSQQNYRW